MIKVRKLNDYVELLDHGIWFTLAEKDAKTLESILVLQEGREKEVDSELLFNLIGDDIAFQTRYGEGIKEKVSLNSRIAYV